MVSPSLLISWKWDRIKKGKAILETGYDMDCPPLFIGCHAIVGRRKGHKFGADVVRGLGGMPAKGYIGRCAKCVCM